MRKIIIIVLPLMIWGILSSSAQISLEDLLGGKATIGDSPSTFQISDALAPALSVIRQQYRLERGGDYYGKSKRPYYGETYTLGIKVSGGTILQRGVIAPWESDEDYQRVNKDNKYKAEWYKTLQHSLQDSIWQTVELELGTQYVSPFNSDSTLYIHTDAVSDFGLPTDDTPGNKQGYLVWAYTSSSLQDSTMRISLRQSSYQVNASPDSTTIALAPSDAGKVIGGLFVVPVIERAGYIKLLMAGVAAKDNDGRWSLHLLTREAETLTRVESNPKEKGKRKKNNEQIEEGIVDAAEVSEPTPIK
ncbi:MAG: hypothetical protein IJP70_01515 [Bacteroidales bacterium]|nr:hypothetical protein [Bacteroidales bacterium]